MGKRLKWVSTPTRIGAGVEKETLKKEPINRGFCEKGGRVRL